MAISSQETPDHPVVNETRARQGWVSHRVIWVLVISTLLAFLALGAAWMFRAHDLEMSNANQKTTQTEAQSFDAPEPGPVTNTAPANPTP